MNQFEKYVHGILNRLGFKSFPLDAGVLAKVAPPSLAKMVDVAALQVFKEDLERYSGIGSSEKSTLALVHGTFYVVVFVEKDLLKKVAEKHNVRELISFSNGQITTPVELEGTLWNPIVYSTPKQQFEKVKDAFYFACRDVFAPSLVTLSDLLSE